ncbi:2-C-methyl-D-erythritol 2,4-cyclodiphosphate synthase [candidate division CSSED10-310 bacterium]|uniref:2-C-methyl-D-erythritol 2,4-cyclodiphosphate synthase n=1 Tax=candidate division CSSED10-310 bacterium TaxID=2855610 RepID=A0ABV6Z130_UNCC1
MYRIGLGYDVHSLEQGYRLILGGVEIPWPRGLVGHSDADVLIHALCDAVLGALGQGDIGKLFPDTDPVYKGIDSSILLRQVIDIMKREEFSIVNVDALVIAQAPRIGPYSEAMKETLCPILEISKNLLNIKATTTEKLGFEGRGEGVATQVIVLLKQTNPP